MVIGKKINIQKPIVQDSFMGKRIVSPANGSGTSRCLHIKNEVGSLLTHYAKMNSKWMKGLNVKAEKT